MTVLTSVPDELGQRGIEPPLSARGFSISLDTAEPWGGGRWEGRIERRGERRSPHPVVVAVRCLASWVDVAPQLVGRKRLLSLTTYWDLRTRAVPIWLDEDVFVERVELGTLAEANWLHFAFAVPRGLPRAFEGRYMSFRWRVEAARRRRIGHERTSLPILLREPRTHPTVRIESSPLGSWRLLELRAEEERDGTGGSCAVSYEEQGPEETPVPDETSESERRRRRRFRP